MSTRKAKRTVGGRTKKNQSLPKAMQGNTKEVIVECGKQPNRLKKKENLIQSFHSDSRIHQGTDACRVPTNEGSRRG